MGLLKAFKRKEKREEIKPLSDLSDEERQDLERRDEERLLGRRQEQEASAAEVVNPPTVTASAVSEADKVKESKAQAGQEDIKKAIVALNGTYGAFFAPGEVANMPDYEFKRQILLLLFALWHKRGGGE